MNQENTRNITAYSLWDYLCEIQKAVQEGYVLSEKNSDFPQAFVSLYTCTLVKEEKPEGVVEIAMNVVEETTQVDTTPVKEVALKDVITNEVKKTTGRKPKAGK